MSEFKLPFIVRAENVEDAVWFATILESIFGYHQGNFVADGKNVRGECDKYDQSYLQGYVRALLDVDDGTVNLE